jgi:hypothetical protein
MLTTILTQQFLTQEAVLASIGTVHRNLQEPGFKNMQLEQLGKSLDLESVVCFDFHSSFTVTHN